jgi:PAS domain-containing protein
MSNDGHSKGQIQKLISNKHVGMKILLYSNRTVEEIKEEFSAAYPYLKISFYTKRQEAEGALTEEMDPSTELIEVSGVLKEGDIDINPTDTIKEVERKFEKQYGLPVHIFRKQNGAWMNTTITDDLTLQEQNLWGREASKPLKTKTDGNFNWNNFSLGK